LFPHPTQLYADKTALTNILSYHVVQGQVGFGL
jgi:hypothetical protein